MKSSFEIHRLFATRTPIKWSEPATEPRRPQTKICKHYLRWSVRSNGTRSKQDQAELRIRRFPLTQNRIRNFADQRETDRRRIVLLHIHKRLDQFALIDAHQLPVFPLEIPDADIGEHLQGRAKAVFRKARAARDAAQAAGLAIEKADQPVPLAERKGAQNNRFRLLERHPFCRRADRPRFTYRQNRATKF